MASGERVLCAFLKIDKIMSSSFDNQFPRLVGIDFGFADFERFLGRPALRQPSSQVLTIEWLYSSWLLVSVGGETDNDCQS